MARKKIEMVEERQDNTVEARPLHHGYDPLTAGIRLYNPSNSSDARAYETAAPERDVAVWLAERQAAQAVGPVPIPVQQPAAAPTHSYAIPAGRSRNGSRAEQLAAAKGRKERAFKK